MRRRGRAARFPHATWQLGRVARDRDSLRGGAAVSPWLQLVVETLRDGQEHGRVRSDVDPLAYIMECIALIVGTFAAADLAAGLSGAASLEASVDRQFREILRIARVSLFTEETLRHQGGGEFTDQTPAVGNRS